MWTTNLITHRLWSLSSQAFRIFKSYWKAFTLFMVTMTYAASALAVDVTQISPLEPPETDFSIQMLNKVFGLTGGSEYGLSLISDLFMIWNGSMMFIGSIIVAYIVVTGTLKTAHEGEVMGQKWNTMLLPLRASLGLAMTAPMVGGFSAIQIAVIWCTVQGVGLADMLWAKVGTSLKDNGGYIYAPMPDGRQYDALRSLYVGLVCMEASNQSVDKWDETAGLDKDVKKISLYFKPPVPPQGSPGAIAGTPGSGAKLLIGSHDGGHYAQSECGGFEWPVAHTVVKGPSTYNTIGGQASTGGSLMGALPGESNRNELISNISSYEIDALKSIAPKLQDLIKAKMKITDEEVSIEPVTAGEMATHAATLAAAHARALANSRERRSQQYKSDNNAYSDNLIKDGWAMAGAYFMRIGSMNAKAQEEAKSKIAMVQFSAGSITDKNVQKVMMDAVQHFDSLSDQMQPGIIKQRAQDNKLTSNPLTYMEGLFGSMQEGVIAIMTGRSVDGSDNDMGAKAGGAVSKALGFSDSSPMMRNQNLGHLLLDAGYIVAGLMLLDKAADALGPVKAAWNLAKDAVVSVVPDSVKAMMGVAAFGLLFAGAMLAFVLPMIPYIIMLFAVLSWLTSVFIAMVAAPLWAISHATPDGHDAFGSGSNGYVLLMAVTLRPALTILAMVGSITILYAIDTLFVTSFLGAFSSAQTDFAWGPIGFIVSIVMFVVLSTVLVYSCFRMISTVPNAILQWIGGRDDDSIGVEQHNDKATTLIGGYSSKMEQQMGAGMARGTKEMGKGMDDQINKGLNQANAKHQPGQAGGQGQV